MRAAYARQAEGTPITPEAEETFAEWRMAIIDIFPKMLLQIQHLSAIQNNVGKVITSLSAANDQQAEVFKRLQIDISGVDWLGTVPENIQTEACTKADALMRLVEAAALLSIARRNNPTSTLDSELALLRAVLSAIPECLNERSAQ